MIRVTIAAILFTAAASMSPFSIDWGMELERSQNLQTEQDQQRRRSEAINVVSGSLAKGEISLANAIDQLEKVFGNYPHFFIEMRQKNPGVSERELIADVAIARVRADVSSEAQNVLVEQLEADLARMRNQDRAK